MGNRSRRNLPIEAKLKCTLAFNGLYLEYFAGLTILIHLMIGYR
jgi:hypothetical protein